MLDTEYDCLIQFVESVLRDETGISENSYLRLRLLADSMHECPDHAERSHRVEGIIGDIILTADENPRYCLMPPWETH